jgi:hypothetical protein
LYAKAKTLAAPGNRGGHLAVQLATGGRDRRKKAMKLFNRHRRNRDG